MKCLDKDTCHDAKESRRDGETCFLQVLRVVGDVFSTLVSLRPLNATSERDFSRIRMELSKREAAALAQGDVVYVAIDPKDIMPLKR